MSGGHDVAGKHVLQVGAGGAGASLAYCLAEAGAAAVTISDIGNERATTLAKLVADTFTDCDLRAGPPDPMGHDIVINATPMGLRPEDPLPLDAGRLQADMIVVDIIMDPVETPLLRHAKALGCQVQYGQPMMDFQMKAMGECLNVLSGPKR
ncbi:shikimate dehydrogenase family protein [Roseovarius sp. S1116L3]|uniref:shikimate dehydrogenase family protein n=1 Tax=Roseovarius roseus TaxID=3342636 RepID=UPI0037282EE1